MIRRVEINLVRNIRSFAKKSPYKFAVGTTLTVFALFNIPVSDCAGVDKKDNNSISDSISRFIGSDAPNGGKKPDPINDFIDQYMPQLQQLGFGGIMGVCTGVALKRLGNEAASVIGLGFVCLQGLSYLGYIKIDYGKVHDDATKLVDADGDGKLTSNDVMVLWAKFKDVMSYNLPGAGGFSAGVMLGVYFGR